MSIVKQIPNMLTMARFVLLIFATRYLFGDSHATALIALGLYACVAITDFLDGYLARTLDATSEFGKLMDPIADKAYILTLFISFACLGVISHWWVWPIVIREVVVTISRLILVREGCVIAAEKSGKVKTFSQNIVLAIIFVHFLNENYWEWLNTVSYYLQSVNWNDSDTINTVQSLNIIIFITLTRVNRFVECV